jgi:hypothetical protein
MDLLQRVLASEREATAKKYDHVFEPTIGIRARERRQTRGLRKHRGGLCHLTILVRAKGPDARIMRGVEAVRQRLAEAELDTRFDPARE